MVRKRVRQALVGREAALAALRSYAALATGGHGRLVLVSGEPGIGKTAVLASVSGDAADGGALVLWSQCWDGDGAPAYWPWVQVLRSAMAAGGDAGAAAVLLPERTSAAASAVSTDAADARFELYDAVVRCLSGLAAQQTVVVVLDDLHWADDDSLRLLEFASRHLAATAVLLLCAYRDEEAGDRLRGLAAGHEHVALMPLQHEDVAALMTGVTGTAPSEAVAADVLRRTGGNPFLVQELTRLLVAQGGVGRAVASHSALLATVGDILGRRLARISQSCADVLTVAAVAGPHVRLDVLARLVQRPEELPALLDEAVSARVLVEPSEPAGTHRFSHDLFRETIRSQIPAPQRVALHLRIGRVLEALRDEGAPVHHAELASHFGAALANAPAETMRYSLLAAEDATARLAFGEARDHCERALAAADLMADVPAADRVEVLLRLGDARNRAGDATSAREAYRHAADVARRSQDADGLARAALGMHGVGWRNVHAEAIDLLEAAADAMPAAASVLRARVLAALARDRHHAWDVHDGDRARQLAGAAVATARQLDDPGTLAFSLLALHDASWRRGTARERLPVIEEMLAISEAVGDIEMVAQARLLRATALIELGDPGGVAELDAYCRQGAQLGHARARYGVMSRRATLALIAGDLAQARALARDALDLGETIGEPDAHGVYQTLVWAAARAEGRHPTGGEHRPAIDDDPWPGLPVLEAMDHVAAGAPDEARRALARLDFDRLPPTHDLELLGLAADVVAEVGTDEQRAALYEQLLSFAGTHIVVGGCASYHGAVDHHLGVLARSLGHAAQASTHFAAAAEMHERLGARAMAARSRDEPAACGTTGDDGEAMFRRDGDVWAISYRGAECLLPDSKGLRDLAVLLATPGRAVHAFELYAGRPPTTGADSVLDDRAKAAYRRRLSDLEADLQEAEADHDSYRASRIREERDTLVTELSAAVGLGGRDRRLGDHNERARKAVTARIRDAIGRITRADPQLGDHLSAAVRTGTWCTYAPSEPVRWRV